MRQMVAVNESCVIRGENVSAVGLPITGLIKKTIFKNRKPATIGLPKALFYFQHYVLWENFFKNIGCNVVVSEDTNKEIPGYGIKHCSNETCLPVKVFHGHVYFLKDKEGKKNRD